MSDDKTKKCPECGAELVHESFENNLRPTEGMSDGQQALSESGQMSRTIHAFVCPECDYSEGYRGGL